MNDVRSELTDEIYSRLQDLQRMDPATEEYSKTLSGTTKLFDRYLEEEKLDLEHRKLDLEEKKISMEEEKQPSNKEKILEKVLRCGTVAAGILTPVISLACCVINVNETRLGRRELFQFETDGCITSKAGQMGYISKPRN